VKCMYRAPDGRRCAIGWLIPDDVYSKALEFFGVRDIAERLIASEHAAFARFLHRHLLLLRDLQEMHDANVPEEWPTVLREIARCHHLNADVVTHCERVYGRTFIAPPPQPVAPAYLLDLLAIMKVTKPINVGVDHGREEREEAREVCST